MVADGLPAQLIWAASPNGTYPSHSINARISLVKWTHFDGFLVDFFQAVHRFCGVFPLDFWWFCWEAHTQKSTKFLAQNHRKSLGSKRNPSRHLPWDAVVCLLRLPSDFVPYGWWIEDWWSIQRYSHVIWSFVAVRICLMFVMSIHFDPLSPSMWVAFFDTENCQYFGELWPKLMFDVKNFQNSEMQHLLYQFAYPLHKWQSSFCPVSQCPTRKAASCSVHDPWWAKKLFRICLVATSPSGWFWCRLFIETGETNHPWRTRTPRQAVKSLFMGFARVVLKNLPLKRTFRMNISRK